MLINALKSSSIKRLLMAAIFTQAIVACTEKEQTAPSSADEKQATEKVKDIPNPHSMVLKSPKKATETYTTAVYEKDGLSVTLPEHWKVAEDGQGSIENRSIKINAEGASSVAIKLFHTDAGQQAKMSMDDYLENYLSTSAAGAAEMKRASMGRAGYRGKQVAIKSTAGGEFDRILEICEVPLQGATAYVLVDSTKENYSNILKPLTKVLQSITYTK